MLSAPKEEGRESQIFLLEISGDIMPEYASPGLHEMQFCSVKGSSASEPI